jgi:hypothetical protein
MTVLRIATFGGRIPRLVPRLLPDTAAQQAVNTRLSSGELRAWWKPKWLATLSIVRPQSVYRYLQDGVQKFIGFKRKTYAVESALVNDAFGRLYYSNEDGFWITTKADIQSNTAAVAAGVPAPIVNLFQVVASGGTDETAETRVYLTTLVSKYGEESAPSATNLVEGNADGVWRVNGLNSLIYDATKYPNITKLRLYRTITSDTGVDYRMAAEFLIGAVPATFVDNELASVISARPALISLAWDLPPSQLNGVISMPGGFLAGFKGRTLYFSEPYYPHAWPPDYQLAVQDDIVALGCFGNTVVIATKGRVSAAVGSHPALMTLILGQKVAPCVSADSMVSSSSAVLFASTEGLISVDSSGAALVTRAFLTKDEWDLFSPANIKAALYENRYLGFYSHTLGFSFQFDDPNTAWTDVQHQNVTAVAQDLTTGRTLLLAGADVLEWNGDTNNSDEYSWKSKPFQLAKPANFGVFQLRGAFDKVDAGRPDVYPLTDITIGDPLGNNEIGLNEVTAIDGPTDAKTDDPAYSCVLFRVYADKKLVYECPVNSEAIGKLPSGYKANEYEVEVTGSVPIYSITLASTAAELAQVP